MRSTALLLKKEEERFACNAAVRAARGGRAFDAGTTFFRLSDSWAAADDFFSDMHEMAKRGHRGVTLKEWRRRLRFLETTSGRSIR